MAVTDAELFERLGLSTHPSSLVKRRSARSKQLLPETRFLDFQFDRETTAFAADHLKLSPSIH